MISRSGRSGIGRVSAGVVERAHVENDVVQVLRVAAFGQQVDELVVRRLLHELAGDEALAEALDSRAIGAMAGGASGGEDLLPVRLLGCRLPGAFVRAL